MMLVASKPPSVADFKQRDLASQAPRGPGRARGFVNTLQPASKLAFKSDYVSRCMLIVPAVGCIQLVLAARRRRQQRQRSRAACKSWTDEINAILFGSEGEVLQSGGYESRPLGKAEAKFCASRGFDPVEWQKHSSPTRYVRDLSGILTGTTTARVMPVVLGFTAWAVLVNLYCLAANALPWLPSFAIPLTPFELTAPLIGYLLVFRTDKSYDRHKEGNEALWILSARLTDLIRAVLTQTSDEDARSPNEVRGLCDLIAEYHTWLLTSYLLQDSVESNRKKYGGPAKSLGHRKAVKLNQRLRRADDAFLSPSHVQLAISQEINRIPRLNEQQRQEIDSVLWDITEQLTKCELLLRCPIPLGYTRSTIRFLWLWLTLLPFALIRTFQEFAGTELVFVEVPLVMFFVSLTFLSLEDVAVEIEEPFAVKRVQLSRLARWFEKDKEELIEISEGRYDELRLKRMDPFMKYIG
eukprot:TRINITY_DN111642_c0_g1_i1.p1 TRINITY_DN111642_c0_g1~~TRINITY_DN111642_c0_g1_i1.p1  ORF type:complete len:468 (+),score=53.32 TRINITY_DN111642_c0_g1_i1:95-1498(+)